VTLHHSMCDATPLQSPHTHECTSHSFTHTHYTYVVTLRHVRWCDVAVCVLQANTRIAVHVSYVSAMLSHFYVRHDSLNVVTLVCV